MGLCSITQGNKRWHCFWISWSQPGNNRPSTEHFIPAAVHWWRRGLSCLAIDLSALLHVQICTMLFLSHSHLKLLCWWCKSGHGPPKLKLYLSLGFYCSSGMPWPKSKLERKGPIWHIFLHKGNQDRSQTEQKPRSRSWFRGHRGVLILACSLWIAHLTFL